MKPLRQANKFLGGAKGTSVTKQYWQEKTIFNTGALAIHKNRNHEVSVSKYSTMPRGRWPANTQKQSTFPVPGKFLTISFYFLPGMSVPAKETYKKICGLCTKQPKHGQKKSLAPVVLKIWYWWQCRGEGRTRHGQGNSGRRFPPAT